MKHFFLMSAVLSVLLFCGCASTEQQQAAAPKQKEDPALEKAREDWKKFLLNHQEEERNRHDLHTLQNDRDRVFPWREGRRSEGIHERRSSSIFSLW